MDDRRSHWPIYDVVPIGMIKIVAETVRNALTESVESKDGMVIYFPKGGESSEKIKKRR
jgi:hypothetical protein